ncbi:MAG: hypothetical protein HUU20_05420 [Pirellulales bacterium]|nr:hypothetical protein [Pirellulales bacterium]
MDARSFRVALLAAVLLGSSGASYRTPNFLINTSDPQLAERFGKAAEKYRKELAESWLGKEMPEWSAPCPVTVHVGQNLGAGGETSFLFDRGEVFGWRMTIQGPADRILDSVLPHEITHMVFASHFRQPLPRWADEGAASSVEHQSEKEKHQRMLQKFLRTGRGIAFNRMFGMTEYPRDVMPLYAQGYTVAEYLIRQGGRRKFVNYLADGLRDNHWSRATKQHYGIENLGALQNSWLAWVGQGFPPLQPASPEIEAVPPATMVAANDRRPRPEPNLIYRIEDKERPAAAAPDGGGPVIHDPNVVPASGWETAGDPRNRPVASPSSSAPLRTQVTHPQPVQQPRQRVIQWAAPSGG